MILQARYISETLTPDDVLSAISFIADRPHASVRLDLRSGRWPLRVTVSVLADGRLAVSCSGMTKAVRTSDIALAARLAVGVLGSMEWREGYCGGYYSHAGVRNAEGYCRSCWVKAGHDRESWAPSGLTLEEWRSFEHPDRRVAGRR